MAKLPILEFPDERLRTRAAPVETVDDEVRRLVDDMLETMYAARGIGLAATQVDVHRRVIVMDVSDAQDRPLVMINPEYTPIGEERDLMSEGCLSIPEYYAEVPRALKVHLKALDRDGKPFELEAESGRAHGSTPDTAPPHVPPTPETKRQQALGLELEGLAEIGRA